jgi:cytidine deaminase
MMELKNLTIRYHEYAPGEASPAEIGILLDLAGQAADLSYAPYSGFHVGMAVELADGRRFMAGNQENKAYPSGICAERTGIFFVQSNYPGSAIRRMLVMAKQNGRMTEEPVYPCGACRQVMVEAEERQSAPFEIWMAGANRILMVESASSLLPFKFHF